MNILMIGNGFDLAHGLPTKYTDFLDFCGNAKKIYRLPQGTTKQTYVNEEFNNWKINSEIKEILEKAFLSRKAETMINEDGTYEDIFSTSNQFLDEFNSCVADNAWINYFIDVRKNIGGNWIDFELEISKVVKTLDTVKANWCLNGTKGGSENKIIKMICKNSKVYSAENLKTNEAINKFAYFLNKELERLIRALEIYIAEFVVSIKGIEKNINIEELKPDCVLSFNYSDTFERLYDADKKLDYDYIHGKSNINNTIESNNMVLGIDEYLPNMRKNKETSFIAFKKYYQRIYKGTGCRYQNWVYEIKESRKSIESKLKTEYPVQIPFTKFTNAARHNLYIFGHSLDETDKEVLKDLILNDNVATVIYYYCKADLGAKIANLVKAIGQDELIRRTSGATKTIEFRMQLDT